MRCGHLKVVRNHAVGQRRAPFFKGLFRFKEGCSPLSAEPRVRERGCSPRQLSHWKPKLSVPRFLAASSALKITSFSLFYWSCRERLF